jgi:peptide/nickel transport system substrate-binding protein
MTTQRDFDEIRASSSELENHVIDEYLLSNITRQDFLRRATALGMSLPLVSILAGVGATDVFGAPGEVGLRKGGNFRLAVVQPATYPTPLNVNDDGGAAVLCIPGEYLCNNTPSGALAPRLATSWKPNKNGSIWTFSIRQGVRFHDGTLMTARDVAATFNRLLATQGGSGAAKATLGGVLSAGAAHASGAKTVVFELDAPNGSFPYLVGAPNYTAIIFPARINPEQWAEKGMIGTGAYKLASYTQKQGARFVRNPRYWDTQHQPYLNSFSLKFFGGDASMVLAFQGGEVDGIGTVSVVNARPLIGKPSVAKIVGVRSAAHRELHMRTDTAPFTDKRVRRAIALALKRTELVSGLYPRGLAEIGNDHPFAPIYRQTVKVPQRAQNIAQAKQLLSAAGAGSGFSVDLTTWDGYEIPDYAQLVQNYASQIGVKINLKIVTPAAFYGSDNLWLTCVMGIVDYAHRAVPNVYLTAPLTSTGVWNAAHFKNPKYDKLVKSYVSAVDLQTQRRLAKQIETLLLDQTPIIFSYFFRHVTIVKPNVSGWYPTGILVNYDPARVAFAK